MSSCVIYPFALVWFVVLGICRLRRQSHQPIEVPSSIFLPLRGSQPSPGPISYPVSPLQQGSSSSYLPWQGPWPISPFQSSFVMDLGFNEGGDAWNYLLQGMRVLGLEADRNLVEAARNSLYFKPFLESGQLILIHGAISNREGSALKFYRYRKSPVHSGIGYCFSGRWSDCDTIDVPTMTCEGLLRKYGVPVYLKIDIERQDKNCVMSLNSSRCPHELPRFVSYEDSVRESEGIRHLMRLRYSRFKFVKQRPYASYKTYLKKGLTAEQANATWPWMTSGPWGNYAYDAQIGYDWHNTDEKGVVESLGLNEKPLGPWADVHAWMFNPEVPERCHGVGMSR
ncbi:unnamed protein product [Amoebophrya sp. A25]|nr:unnamed protein product [Amoebophrya sp. A25]|eukprot:GSA25T00021301001.1